jgi:hypothetical protein
VVPGRTRTSNESYRQCPCPGFSPTRNQAAAQAGPLLAWRRSPVRYRGRPDTIDPNSSTPVATSARMPTEMPINSMTVPLYVREADLSNLKRPRSLHEEPDCRRISFLIRKVHTLAFRKGAFGSQPPQAGGPLLAMLGGFGGIFDTMQFRSKLSVRARITASPRPVLVAIKPPWVLMLALGLLFY